MLIAFDGTWQDATRDPATRITNVHRFALRYRGLSPESPEVDYVPGVGSGTLPLVRFFGGVAGLGSKRRIETAIASIQYLSDDEPIDVIGASRGGAQAYQFTIDLYRKHKRQVRFCGVWDLVMAMGWNAPKRVLPIIPKRVRFKYNLDRKAPRPPSKFFYHAAAGDEHDPKYRRTPVQGPMHERKYFEGGHGQVIRSPESLEWMIAMFRKSVVDGLGSPFELDDHETCLGRIEFPGTPPSH